jgi:hypothetical protein
MKYNLTLEMTQAQADLILLGLWSTNDPNDPRLHDCRGAFIADRAQVYSYIGKDVIISTSIEFVQ